MLKSPPHTARVDLLLELFPNAKFIPMLGLGHLDGFTHIDVMLPHIKKFLEAHDAKA